VRAVLDIVRRTKLFSGRIITAIDLSLLSLSLNASEHRKSSIFLGRAFSVLVCETFSRGKNAHPAALEEITPCYGAFRLGSGPFVAFQYTSRV
jgi:hypothetical protein